MNLPELGPVLGSLVEPAGNGVPGDPLDAARLAMVGALFEKAAEARKRLADGDPNGARRALGAQAWLSVWEAAAARSAASLLQKIESDLRDAAVTSRYPKQALSRELPSAEDRRMLAARLTAAGLGLEAAAPELDRATDADWPHALRRAAGELEQAWDEMREDAARERMAWDARTRKVSAWRRPWWPLVLATAVGIAVAGWFGLILGGYLPVPEPLRPLVEWVWGLSWP